METYSVPKELTQQWTVWCVFCTKWDSISGSKMHAKREFKHAGWLFKKEIGWYCKHCKPKKD